MTLATEEIGEPLTDDQVRALGYEPTSKGWVPLPKSGRESKPRQSRRPPKDQEHLDATSAVPGPESPAEPSRAAAGAVRRAPRTARPKRPAR